MKLLLAVLLVAGSLPSHAEVLSLGFREDGKPFMVLPKAALAAPEGADVVECSSPEQACESPVSVAHILVAPKAVDVLPASKELAKATLGAVLDSATRIPQLHWKFNKRMFYVTTAFDRADKVYFGFFTGKAGEEVLEPEDGRLLKSTIPVQIDAETKYIIRLQIDIFNPMKSKIIFAPAQGFAGDTHKKPANELMALVKAAGVAVPFSKGELTFYYSTDVDGAKKKLADTRSYRFVKEDGRNTKAYTIREEALEKGKWHQADLGGQSALLMRTADDILLIHEPN